MPQQTEPMRTLTALILTTGLTFVFMATAEESDDAPPAPPGICKSTDAAGNTVFSDHCGDRGSEVELREASVFTPPKRQRTRPRSGNTPELPGFTPYRTLAVTSPEPGTTLRDNAGSVSITVSVEPPLNAGHRLEVRMDGTPVGFANGGGLSLSNVDRGEHELSVHVVDANGRSLQQSKTTHFTLHRASRLHRRGGG